MAYLKSAASMAFVLFAWLAADAQDKSRDIEDFKNPFLKKSQVINATMSKAQSSESQNNLRIPVSNGGFHQDVKALSISREQVEQNLRGYLGLSDKSRFVKSQERTDELGINHVVYQQYIGDIPVEDCFVISHNRGGKAESINGKVMETETIQLKPAVSKTDAYQIALDFVNVKTILNNYPVELVALPPANGVVQDVTLVYKVRVDAATPFTMCIVYVDAVSGLAISKRDLVAHADAIGSANTLYSGVQSVTHDSFSGGFRLRDNGRKIETYNATNATINPSGFVGATDITNASSTWQGYPKLTGFSVSSVAQSWWYTIFADEKPDLYIVVKDGADQIVYQSNYKDDTNPPVAYNGINLLLTNPPYKVELWDYDSFDADDLGATVPVPLTIGTQSWTANGNSGSFVVGSQNNPALDVHWGMEKTFDFYQTAFSRSSFDGLGSTIKNFLNPSPSLIPTAGLPNNAFALPAPYNMMVFGLGDGSYFGPVVGLDVEGHEYTHMVVNFNGHGGLNYQGESGALNESFADIFGTCVEFSAKGAGANWTIGEDVAVAASNLRSMSDPNNVGGLSQQPDTYGGQFWVNPATAADDNGGVHTNSGVQNYWFYLLSQGGSGTNDLGKAYSVTGIGITQARQIAYRNLTTYLTPNATYLDSYNGSLQAAQDLFGNPSTQYSAVRAAWYAVGLGNDPSNYCSGTTKLTSATGTVSDGSGTASYLNNAACKWIIAPPGANQVSLNFTAFNTETINDIVYAYDGPDDTYPILLTWSGSTLPATVNSTGGAICLKFVSSASVTGPGWSANYTSSGISPSCGGGSVLSASNGTFSDGSGSASYGNNQLCYWLIAPPCATSVTLSVTQLDTELNYDGLVVYNGPTVNSPNLGVFSGSSLPTNVVATSGQMLVVFISDYSNTQGGFSASYTSTSTGSMCSGMTTVNSSDSGTITDGSGVNVYCNNLDCKWLIQPPQATSVTLNFTAFDLEAASSDGKSIYDAVEVYDGTTTSATLLGRFTGSNLPPRVSSTGGSMLVRFYSDPGVTKQGWSATYTSKTNTFCSGPQSLTTATGTLSDGSGANLYGNNTQCSWLIKPEKSKTITLTFSSFDTELNADGVIVYDGETNTSPVLGKFSGSSLPAAVTSTGGSMYIEFITNQAGRAQGWAAAYTSTVIVGLEDSWSKGLVIFPNPSSGVFFVRSEFDNSVDLEILDLKGARVKCQRISKGENRIETSDMTRGTYLLKFQTEAKVVMEKIVLY